MLTLALCVTTATQLDVPSVIKKTHRHNHPIRVERCQTLLLQTTIVDVRDVRAQRQNKQMCKSECAKMKQATFWTRLLFIFTATRPF